MLEHPVISLLSRWPSRQAVCEDARAADPNLDPVAVHRWFQRRSVPSRYWAALMDGAARRAIALSADEIVRAHSDVQGDAA
jgi:hypothetical protein